jgi:hypothetical protein
MPVYTLLPLLKFSLEYLKVKVSIEQAMQGQNISSGITLLFL